MKCRKEGVDRFLQEHEHMIYTAYAVMRASQTSNPV
jgi:hypothetical protein